jgi:hypothetical protein
MSAPEPTRLVLATHARSGSNSLVEILNLAPGVSILNEPFNERFTQWSPGNPDYRDRVVDIASLDVVMNEIFASWSGIKSLGYQLELPLFEHLLLRPDVSVIFLRRRNLLETVVSNLIALQTNLWKTWDATMALEDHYAALDPIPVEEVMDTLRWTQTRLDEIEAIVDRRANRRVVKLAYEDLYLVEPERQEQLLRLGAVSRPGAVGRRMAGQTRRDGSARRERCRADRRSRTPTAERLARVTAVSRDLLVPLH